MLRDTPEAPVHLLFFVLTACTTTQDSDTGKAGDTDTGSGDTDTADTDSGIHDTDSGGGDTDSGTTDTDSGGGDTDSGADTGDSGGDDTAPDTDPDSGHDTVDTGGDDTDVSDTATDTGGDDTADSGGGGDDTGDSGAPDTGPGETGGSSSCPTGTSDDLLWSVEIQDGTGAASSSWPSTTSLSVVGVVSNPCSVDLDFTVSCSTDFVSDVELEDSHGMGMGMGIACGGPVTTWTVPAGGRLEDPFLWGTLKADTYVAKVGFMTGITATTSFSTY